MTGIYKITETATGLCYIGQSICIERRWKKHHKRFIPDTHTYEVLMTCNAEALNRMERFMISVWNTMTPSGLNRTVGGNATFGPPSEETRRKISEAKKGKTVSEETRRKISEANKGKHSGNLSEEHRRKLSEAGKGRPHSEESRRKISEAQKGKTHSDEHRRKVSEAKKNPSEETRRKMSEAKKGKKMQPRSEEHCRKISEAKKAYYAQKKLESK